MLMSYLTISKNGDFADSSVSYMGRDKEDHVYRRISVSMVKKNCSNISNSNADEISKKNLVIKL